MKGEINVSDGSCNTGKRQRDIPAVLGMQTKAGGKSVLVSRLLGNCRKQKGRTEGVRNEADTDKENEGSVALPSNQETGCSAQVAKVSAATLSCQHPVEGKGGKTTYAQCTAIMIETQCERILVGKTSLVRRYRMENQPEERKTR